MAERRRPKPYPGLPPAADAPLAGLRVLDLTRTIAGAVATLLLADFGANVSVAEPKAGHALQGHPGWRVWRRGKTPVTLDITTAAGRRRALALAQDIDIVIDDLSPAEAASSGFPAAVAAISPRVIHTTITAAGTSGPWRDLPADDALALALSGAMSRQASHRPGPAYFVMPIASFGAALLALHGTGAALVARERGRQGPWRVETSLFAGAMAMESSAWVKPENPPQIEFPMRGPQGSIPLYRLYQTQDGRWLHVGGLTPRFWPRAAIAFGQPELISDERFQAPPGMGTNANRKALMDILAAAFDKRPYHEWDEILEEADIPFGPSMTVDEYRVDPQVRQQELVVTTDDPEVGPFEQMGRVIKWSAPGTTTEPPPPLPDAPHTPPLAGIRLIDASGYIAGAYGGGMLADLGADVIKVESEGSDGLRGNMGFQSWNLGKRAAALDVRDPRARDAYLRLVATADAVLENMRPGVAERLGTGYEAVRAVNPRAVYCYVSAHGSTGPYRHKPGFDPIMQARSGIERAQGGLFGPPVFLIPPVTDNTAAMLNAFAILMGLYKQAQTGIGIWVETSLMAAAALLQSDSLTQYEGRPPRPANDRDHLGPHALRRLYPCKDGWLLLVCQEEREWQSLCAVARRPWVADPRFATAALRLHNDLALAAEIGGWLGGRALSRTVAALRRRGVPCVPATGTGMSLDEPQVAENGYRGLFRHRQYGRIGQGAGWTRVNGVPSASRCSGPMIGEDTREVLLEAGLTHAEIDALIAAGVAQEVAPPVAARV